MDTKDIHPENPQSFQLATVAAISEMRGEVKRLADSVNELKDELKHQNETYVTITTHARDIQDVYQQVAICRKDLQDRIEVGDKTHNELRQTGKSKAVLWSIFTALVTSVILYEVMKAIK